MIAVDTNILVYAHRRDALWHDAAQDCIRGLAEGRITWGIPWPCVHEFLAIVTHPKIYAPPSSLDVALDQVQAWLESPVVELLGETTGHWELLQTQLRNGKIHGPMVHDARIATICLGHGVVELLSADRDFSRFATVKVRNPLVN